MVNKTVVGSSLEGDLEGGKEEAPGHSTTILHPDRMLWVSRWAPGELRGGSARRHGNPQIKEEPVVLQPGQCGKKEHEPGERKHLPRVQVARGSRSLPQD